jgi:hypothetical protein
MKTPLLLRRLIHSSPQLNINPVCPAGFLPVTVGWRTESGTGSSGYFVEATNYQDAFAAMRADFNSPTWAGYTLSYVSI